MSHTCVSKETCGWQRYLYVRIWHSYRWPGQKSLELWTIRPFRGISAEKIPYQQEDREKRFTSQTQESGHRCKRPSSWAVLNEGQKWILPTKNEPYRWRAFASLLDLEWNPLPTGRNSFYFLKEHYKITSPSTFLCRLDGFPRIPGIQPRVCCIVPYLWENVQI